MKMKIKTIAIFSIGALFVGPAIESCKRGEDDPGLSLRSRTARLAGEWKMESYEESYKNVTTYRDLNTSTPGDLTSRTAEGTESWDGNLYTNTEKSELVYDNGDKSSNDLNFNGTSGKVTSSSTTSGSTFTSSEDFTGSRTESATMTIENDGTFESVTTIEYSYKYEDKSDSDYDETRETKVTETVTMGGTWSWMGKNKSDEFGNKERVAFSVTSMTRKSTEEETITYVDKDATDGFDWTTQNSKRVTESDESLNGSDMDVDFIWQITMLKNKELEFKSQQSEITRKVDRKRTVGISSTITTVLDDYTVTSTTDGAYRMTQD